MQMKTKAKKINKRPLRRWVQKVRTKQRGGFIGLLISGLTALGMSASAAATTATIAAPVITGALGATGAAAVNAIAQSGKGRRIAGSEAKPLGRHTRRRHVTHHKRRVGSGTDIAHDHALWSPYAGFIDKIKRNHQIKR